MKGGRKMKNIDVVAQVLIIVGALNWGLYAIGEKFELVQYLQIGWLITLVYAIVGLAGLYGAIKLLKK